MLLSAVSSRDIARYLTTSIDRLLILINLEVWD